jgi:hypothetical protein
MLCPDGLQPQLIASPDAEFHILWQEASNDIWHLLSDRCVLRNAVEANDCKACNDHSGICQLVHCPF